MICIIPARGNSKRLPGKNIRALDGEPIINRVIKVAKDSGLFSEIIVTTDSKQIAEIVLPYAKIHITELHKDGIEDIVLKDAMKDETSFCRIYAFAALLTPDRLRAGHEQFKTGKYENVHECQEYTHLIWRAIAELREKYVFPSYVSLPTQDILPTYHEAGTYMFTTLEALNKPLEERRIKWMAVSEMEAQDIDDEGDWQMLEAKWNWRNR